MEQIGIQLTESLPIWYRLIFITFITLVGIFYLLPRIRRDKMGKIYFYSQKYEDTKRNEKQNKTIETLDKFTRVIDTIEQRQLDIAGKLDKHIENDKTIIEAIHTDIAESKQDRLELKLDNWKQSVYLKEMDIEERIYAGLRYIYHGGNGTVATYIKNELISQAPTVYHTAIRIRPELAIKDIQHL